MNILDGTMLDKASKNDELQKLMERCVERDQAAFNELYDQTSKRLFATLLNILKIEAVAEEALQETYIKIWDKVADYQSELGQPLTWMTSIARYQALDVLRKRRIRENQETSWDDTPLLESSLSQPDPAQMSEFQDILEQCFGKLSDDQRQCILRAYLEGLTHDELSESTQSPVGTIKSWIRRGLLSLRECVDELSR